MIYRGYVLRYLIIFACLVIHEIAHITAAIIQKEKISSVRIFPIGLNALIEEDPGSDSNALIINISGPLINVLLFTASLVLNTYYLTFSDNMRFFVFVNISLAIFNMLPVLPLDGGKILKDILASKIGLFKAYKYTRRISAGVAALLIVLGIILFFDGIYNFSIVLIGSYIFYFLKYEDAEVSLMNIKNIVYRHSRFLKKGVYPGRELVVIKSMRLGEVLKSMDFDRFHIIYVLDDNMKLAKVLTEQEVVDSMIKYNSEISFDELLKYLA